MWCIQSVITHAERETLDAGTTRTRLGRTRVDVSQVTTCRPSRNFPGVAPPAPQIQIVWLDKQGDKNVHTVCRWIQFPFAQREMHVAHNPVGFWPCWWDATFIYFFGKKLIFRFTQTRSNTWTWANMPGGVSLRGGAWASLRCLPPGRTSHRCTGRARETWCMTSPRATTSATLHHCPLWEIMLCCGSDSSH